VGIAALYDVHGNVPALEAVLAELDGLEVGTILIGGDVASGPMPAETLDLLDARPETARFVRGNADRVLDFSGDPGDDPELWRRTRLWVAEQLGEERLAFLAGLPLDLTLDVDGLGPVRFCHGAPGSDMETITRVTPDDRLRALLAGVEERAVVCGHTHVQFDRTLDGVRVVNAGSVGFPYEAEPAAYWLLLDPGLQHRRTDYDVGAAAERILSTTYPNRETYARDLMAVDPERPGRLSRLIEFGS
jgi:diadenosine tetraphosphatase ApaH/serine/threonine PP2A family protein phosphatase